MNIDYLKRILTSKVYDVAIETPLDRAPQLSARLGNTILLKREDTQPVFSFKLRGAYNKMAHLTTMQWCVLTMFFLCRFLQLKLN